MFCTGTPGIIVKQIYFQNDCYRSYQLSDEANKGKGSILLCIGPFASLLALICKRKNIRPQIQLNISYY